MSAPGHRLSWGKEGPVPAQKRETKVRQSNLCPQQLAHCWGLGEVRQQAGLLAQPQCSCLRPSGTDPTVSVELVAQSSPRHAGPVLLALCSPPKYTYKGLLWIRTPPEGTHAAHTASVLLQHRRLVHKTDHTALLNLSYL